MKAERDESQGRRSSSLSTRKDQVRHYIISSSSSSSSRSRSRSSSRSGGRSRSPKYHRGHRHKHSKKRYHSGSRKRSRSRSRSHSHGPSGPSTSGQSAAKQSYYYGTNSSDPRMIASRLFLGNLPYEITKDDLRGIFSKYGKIIGLTLLKGFGFIQYETEEIAQAAVNGERGSSLKGFAMDVKLASERKDKKNYEEDNANRLPPPGYQPPPPRPPLPGIPMPGPGGPIPGPPPFGPPMPFLHRPLPPPDIFRRHSMMEPFVREPHPDFPPLPPHHPPGPVHPAPLPSVPPLPAVDCRILVLNAQLRTYADGIKKRLMAAGIVTELSAVLESEVMMAIEDATRQRLLFVVVVTEQNEIHRSITVNILHGMAQEHRNMPVDDAVILITRSFDKYMLDRRERTEGLGAGVGRAAPPAREGQSFLQPSPRIQNLLDLLAERRHLTATELTLIIDYLVERRHQLDSSSDIPARSDGAGDQSLRRPALPASGRIVDVDERNAPVSQPAAKHPAAVAPRRDELPIASSSAKPNISNVINLDNPSIKQALDQLISSGPNILKNISDTLAQKSSSIQYNDPNNHR